ncbi:MAG: response regulator [Sulfuricellaceae bacterium]|nr:response regulator [Sulfuricellaceae bacterium]
MRALVVDDVDVNRELFKMHLACAAQHIDEAADGFAALDLFKQRRYDAVLLDIEMPGLDGYETLVEMRKWEQAQALPMTLILAVTSSDFPGDEQRIMGAGATAYLVKPLKQRDLMKALELFQPAELTPHPLANLFPRMFAHADTMLDELEACDEPDAVSKKLHQLRGMMAVYGFEDFAEHLKQIHFMMQHEGILKKTVFDQLRNELHDLKMSPHNAIR